MSTTRLPCVPSIRRQQLHLEFASLRNAAPPGVYVSLAPSDPTLWNGVIFIRFPDVYPDLPPLVTFATDVFHPLIVPLTTYTFSTNSASDDPVSATDEERLPPGGFSLRHGFPHWFGRARRRSGVASGKTSRNVSGTSIGTMSGSVQAAPSGPMAEGNTSDGRDPVVGSPSNAVNGEDTNKNDGTPQIAQVPSTDQFAEAKKFVPVADLLNYIRSTFDDAEVLDSLPSEAAANPGAWHAWKAHRRGGARSGDLKRGKPAGSAPRRLALGWHLGASSTGRDRGEPFRCDVIRFSRMDDATRSSVKEKMESVVNVTKS
ncbi:uncharacterized protein N7477_002287 [Penicillium maclennaniae]|uniref:uncharacterized protein n=1 Tax=Penicillium maclennaniae TaxID=1343394 RepID=UPI00253FA953|nr:uncharacterized protein N7477_002287 [Penicillium maclennaniae]KAJ5676654.1 hypothetical protein N7477_002287 [Penicillium maclennaniae]